MKSNKNRLLSKVWSLLICPIILFANDYSDYFYSNGKKINCQFNMRSLGRINKNGHFSEIKISRSNIDRKELFKIAQNKRNRNYQPEKIGVIINLENSDTPLILTDQISLRLKPDVSELEFQNLLEDHSLYIVQRSEIRKGRFIIAVEEEQAHKILQITNNLYKSGLFVYCQPDFRQHIQKRVQAVIPNDPLFEDQWHLHNTGQNGGLENADISAPEAWSLSSGKNNIIISFIDDGFDYSHSDLNPNYLGGYDFRDDDDNPDAERGDYHGTAVTGLAVAKGNNIEGVSGVCPNCNFLALRATHSGYYSDVADAIDYASTNSSIINCSWGLPQGTPIPDDLRDAINNAAENGRDGKGCLIIFSAPNELINGCEGDTPDISSLDNVVAVSSSTNYDKAGGNGFGECLDVLAPSSPSPIVTTDVQGIYDGYSGGDYTNYVFIGSDVSGTSFAAPIVSGIAGLILSITPGIDRQQVQRIINISADKIEFDEANYNNDGHSLTHGYGRVNALKATQIATWYGVMSPILSLLN